MPGIGEPRRKTKRRQRQSTNGFLRRPEQLAQTIRIRRPRWITILVDGNSEDQSAADAIVQELEVTPDDTVIYLARFSGTDPDLPRLGSITDL